MLCALPHFLALQSKTHLKDASEGRRGRKIEGGHSRPLQSICAHDGLDVKSPWRPFGFATHKVGCLLGNKLLPIRRSMGTVVQAAYQKHHYNAGVRREDHGICVFARDTRVKMQICLWLSGDSPPGYTWIHPERCNGAAYVHAGTIPGPFHRCLCCICSDDKLGPMQIVYRELE